MVICTSGNAVILKDDGRMINYRRQCPSCGYVDEHELASCSIPSGKVRQNFTYRCSKCHKDMGAFEFERR